MTDTTNQAPAMSAEQAQDLAALQEFANGAPIVPGSPEAIEAEKIANRPKLADEIAGAVSLFVSIAGPMFPSLKTIYTDETTQAAAAAIAAVCDKHGWIQGGIMGEWGEEISALIVCGPLAVATYHGIKGDIAAREQRARQVGAGSNVPGRNSDTGTPAQTIDADGTVNQNTVTIGGVPCEPMTAD